MRKLFLLGALLMIAQPVLADTLRIQPSELKTVLNEKAANIVILDTRSEQAYRDDHIPGARSFPVEWTYQHKRVDGQLASPHKMQQLLRSAGLTADSQVVVYDDGKLVDAARTFWVLEVFGLKQVMVLDGGYAAWQKQGFAVEYHQASIEPSQYTVQINHKRLASKFTTQLAVLNPFQTIVDARPYNAYIGEVSSAQRFGHIPTAINIPASHNIDTNQTDSHFQSLEKLKEVYQDLPKGHKVITYCAIGRISAANYLALRELGYDVANYDASWKEWANDFSLPVEKGDPAQITQVNSSPLGEHK
ncbi:rhodanese-like domain-containing protein [Thiomicrorhabdus sp. zzn3]|uniref:sulfurtransferase n=1 Tax=Thiomicrorhabdus sp. zzn3 TaxID=3039775 RepID=UPI002436A24D|nr:rhodanese-like domain-containing protein [Thiomicrorhabdus sp. zzn3]MDG6778190.1 rhodanese-like domain-containing protein [Thiomicrorhabdus sp. zzn3]